MLNKYIPMIVSVLIDEHPQKRGSAVVFYELLQLVLYIKRQMELNGNIKDLYNLILYKKDELDVTGYLKEIQEITMYINRSKNITVGI